MNKTQIEMRAIMFLEEVLTRSQYIIPEIPKNDKTPSWDGNIFIYNKSGTKKKDLIGKIDVQVKGHYNKKSFNDKINYSVNVFDLRNYLNDSGVIYFVIYMKNFDEYKIYYNTLLPFDLTCLLKKAKDQKSKSIELIELPTDELKIRDILTNFIRNRRLQGAIDPKFLSIEDVDKANLLIESYNFGYSGPGTKLCSPIEYALSNPTYIYLKPFDIEVYLPVGKATFTKFVQTLVKNIKVDGIVKYTEYDVLHTKEKSVFKIGRNIEIDFFMDRIRFKDKGLLSDRIKDIEFFIAILEKKNILIGEISFPTDKMSSNEDAVKNIFLKQKKLLEIKRLLELLEIKEDLNLDDLTDKGDKNLAILIDTVLNGELLPVKTEDLPLVGNMKVGNLCIALVCIKVADGKYRLYNYFDKNNPLNPLKATYEDGINELMMSPYILMKRDEINIFSNISYENIYQSIISIQYDEKYFSLLNQFILELIHAYDDSGKIGIYELVLKILDWMIIKQPISDNIYSINKFQILKRRRQLTTEELEMLLQIKDEEKDLMMLTAICILIDSFSEANLYYIKLDEEAKRNLKGFPIYQLWEENKALNH